MTSDRPAPLIAPDPEVPVPTPTLLELWLEAARRSLAAAVASLARAGEGRRALAERLSRVQAPARPARVRPIRQPRPASPPSRARAWRKALRLHHWSKNLLVLAPALLANRSSLWLDVWHSGVAFAAFSLVASATYLVNDAFDLPHDRVHPRKRHRPIAAGLIPLHHAAWAALVLGAAAFIIGGFLGAAFNAVLAGYVVLTVAYSMTLKRLAVADVLTLAALFVLRIIAGALAANVPLSPWFLAFSMFLFTSLGFAKRTSEIVSLAPEEADPAGRGYRRSDRGVLIALGSAAGYTAVVVFALYIHAPDIRPSYGQPDILWLAAVSLMAWVSRMWLLAQRGAIGDDPVDFTIRDPASLLLALTCALAVVAAR